MAEAAQSSARESGLATTRSLRSQSSFRRFLRNRAAAVGGVILAVMIGLAIAAPVIAPYDPLHQELGASLTSPSGEHWFGTDYLGRDVFSRVLYGGRVTIPFAFLGVAFALLAGVPVGLVAGYYSGFKDGVIMRLTDILLAFPSLLLAMAIMSTLGISLIAVSISIAVFSTPVYIRLVRAEVLRLREREFVTAARAMGSPNRMILFKHVLPNAFSPIIIQASLNMALAILTVSALSFIGLGAQPPTPEWGVMLADSRSFMQVAPGIAAFSGIAIFLTILGFNLVGDGLRDVYDPHSAR